MSKGSAHLFAGTSGEGKALIQELLSKGIKVSPEKVVLIARDPQGKIIWMETGDDASGLAHILKNHTKDFAAVGVPEADIPNYVLEAVYQTNIVGMQGKRNPRAIYEFVYNGVVRRLAVQVASNGYIVSANPQSMKGALK